MLDPAVGAAISRGFINGMAGAEYALLIIFIGSIGLALLVWFMQLTSDYIDKNKEE